MCYIHKRLQTYHNNKSVTTASLHPPMGLQGSSKACTSIVNSTTLTYKHTHILYINMFTYIHTCIKTHHLNYSNRKECEESEIIRQDLTTLTMKHRKACVLPGWECKKWFMCVSLNTWEFPSFIEWLFPACVQRHVVNRQNTLHNRNKTCDKDHLICANKPNKRKKEEPPGISTESELT